jgi:diketogulonate reductase-like aldo/keto reductase
MPTGPIRTITFPGAPPAQTVPVLGQGTWTMGESHARAAEETAALRLGVELGMTLIDTAEMYGEGATESFLGRALAGLRESIFLVSKVYPQNAGGKRLVAACEGSLKRLGTDRLDLYLLHWPGAVPLAETVEGMEALQRAGKIRRWGVSNFDVSDMEELIAAGGTGCATNQILYNPTRRGPEHDLLPWLERHRIPFMAYSPVEQGRLPERGALRDLAARHGASIAQIALAWTLRDPGAIAIPKAGTPAHVRDNRAAMDLRLTPEDVALLDGQFPPPSRKKPLEML